MATYDIKAVMSKLNKLNGTEKKEKAAAQVKINWWKPKIGANEIRFLPYNDGNNQPFQEISYYTSKRLSDNRIVAPYQWGLQDAIQDLMAQLKKNRENDLVWKQIKELKPRESFYTPILVRGEEDKGVQIWEMSQNVVTKIYQKLSHPDYAEEDLFDPKEGYDFTVTATETDKKFNGYPVKNLDFEVRRKPSPVAKTQKERDDLVATIPNLKEHFKSFTPNEERMNNYVTNFLTGGDDSDGVDELDKIGTEKTKLSDKTDEITSKLNDAFSDL